MPPDPPEPAPGAGRRTVLRLGGLALAVAGLGACGVRWEDVRVDDVPTPDPPVLSVDDLARFSAVVEVRALLDLAAGLAVPPAAAVAVRHRSHLVQLGPLPGPVPSPSATPSGWPTTPPPPAGAGDAATLAAAEQRTAALLLTSATEGEDLDGGLARLLVAVATSCRASGVDLGAEVPAPAPLPGPDGVDPAGLRAAAQPLAGLVEAHRIAAYGYGVLAVRLSDPRRAAARAALAAHGGAADALVALGAAAATEVPPAQPAYLVQRPADDRAATALALGLELDVAGAAGALVAAGTGGWRALAADQVLAAALTARTWGALPPFPGLPGLP